MYRRGNLIDLNKLQEDPEAIYELLDSVGSDLELEDEDEEIVELNSNEPGASIENASESESDEDDNIPLSFFRKQSWKKGTFDSHEDPTDSTSSSDAVRTPWQYFKNYLDEDFYSLGATSTSQYYLQKTGKILNVSATEIKKFFGLHAIMGCISFPRIHMYWNSKFKFAHVSDVMARDKFYLVRVNFHVVDNLSVPEETQKKNRLWKVQPMIDRIRNRCRAIPRGVRQSYSIDEQMIPFLGKCPVRQFVKNKPRPVGLKNFVVTSSEGMVLDFEIYQGSTTAFENRDLGIGPSVILHLVKSLPKESYIFFDRYFSTIPLIDKLLSLDIYATATIMQNRVKICTFKRDREMIRGESEEFVRNDKKVCLTKWMDNKSVIMLSSAFGTEPIATVKRWDKVNKIHKDVSCPKAVRMYNKKMGGVDLVDQMLEYYRSFFKTRKWTFKLILHLFDLAIVNSWMEYRLDLKSINPGKKPMDLLDFRLSLGEYLISSEAMKRPRRDSNEDEEGEGDEGNKENKRNKNFPSAMPCPDKRYDKFEHWPSNDDLKHPLRCRMENCDSRSRVRCTKCDIYLCFNKTKNCFLNFHRK